jgi:hypothetical protein
MIINDDERVVKSRKMSAGRLRERCADMERRKAVRVWRTALGNDSSAGKTGAYHHLHSIRQGYSHNAGNILDIVANDGIRQLCERGRRLWLELGEVEWLP